MTKRGFRPVAASQLSSRCPMSPEATKNSLSSAVQAELSQKVPWLECIEASAETGGSNQHPALLERQDYTRVAWYRAFTHLAREGRMTVTMGRRELLAALGGAAAAWPWAPPLTVVAPLETAQC